MNTLFGAMTAADRWIYTRMALPLAVRLDAPGPTRIGSISGDLFKAASLAMVFLAFTNIWDSVIVDQRAHLAVEISPLLNGLFAAAFAFLIYTLSKATRRSSATWAQGLLQDYNSKSTRLLMVAIASVDLFEFAELPSGNNALSALTFALVGVALYLDVTRHSPLADEQTYHGSSSVMPD